MGNDPMNVHMSGEGDRDKRLDPYQLFYRFFSLAIVIVALLWLSIHREFLLQVAKFTIIVAALFWSRVPMQRSHGIGSIIPVSRTRRDLVFRIIAGTLTGLGFCAVLCYEYQLGRNMHWIIGAFILLLGSMFFFRNLFGGRDEKADNTEAGR